MATKQFYATGAFKYNHRMLSAGDPVELDGPSARLFTALGKISPTKPASGGRIEAAPPIVGETPGESLVRATKAPRKRAAAKRTRRKK